MPEPDFDPGPPREPITDEEMPAAEDLPGIVEYLLAAGAEVPTDG